MNKPADLHRKQEDLLEKELRISVKSLLFIVFLVILFFIFAIIMQPTTYGFF